MKYLIWQLYAYCFGSLVGSFANVLIDRLPREMSIVRPRSHCFQCGKTIPWYENIPVFSFLFLRGKCSTCKNPIPVQYPFIEALCGLVAMLMLPAYLSPTHLFLYLFYFTIFVVFLCHFIIDLRHQILPDILNAYLGLLFVVYAFLYLSWKSSLLGLGIGFLLPAGVTWAFYYWRGKIGLGGGDIKLFAVLGIYLGPAGVIQNIFLSCLLGSVVGLLLIMSKRMDAQRPLPFGPFILIVASLQIFFPKIYGEFFSLIH